MTKVSSNPQRQATESYKENRIPSMSNVFDFRHFSGYAGEYTSDLLIYPRETD